jgi:hypothetical protein
MFSDVPFWPTTEQWRERFSRFAGTPTEVTERPLVVAKFSERISFVRMRVRPVRMRVRALMVSRAQTVLPGMYFLTS